MHTRISESKSQRERERERDRSHVLGQSLRSYDAFNDRKRQQEENNNEV